MTTRTSTVKHLIGLARTYHGERGALLLLALAVEPDAVCYADFALAHVLLADLDRVVGEKDTLSTELLREMGETLEAAEERDVRQQQGLGWQS